MTRLDDLRNFAADAADRITGNVSTVRNAVGDLLGEGLATPETPIEQILSRLGDLLRVGEGEELPLQSPFSGGQCEIPYEGTFSFTATIRDTGDTVEPNPVVISCFENVFGPLSVETLGEDDDGGPRIIVSGFNSQGQVFQRFGGTNPFWESVSFTGADITPCGAGADNCGDPPPEYGDEPGAEPIEVGDDGGLTGPNLPTLPDGWRPELCGLDLELPCPGISICAGGFRATVGPCGIELDLDPRDIGGGDAPVENVDPEVIDDVDVGGDGEGEVAVGDEVVSVWIEALGSIPSNIRVVKPSPLPDRVERWLGFVSTGTQTGSGTAYSTNTPLSYGRNYYRLESVLSDRTVKVRSPDGVTWRVTDTGERCDKCGQGSGE